MDDDPQNLDWPFRALTVFILTCGVALAFYGLSRALWLDDTHSTFHAFAGPGHVMDSLRTDSHPPLYFLLLSLWMDLGGMGEAWLRLPSLLFTWAAAASLFVFARRSMGPRIAWLTALFFLFHPVVTGHLHTVRPYALLGLEAAISTILYTRLSRAAEGSHRGSWIAYVIINILGTFTHYWYIFLLAGQGVGALAFGNRRARPRMLLALVGSALPFAVFGTPLLLSQVQGTPTNWLGVPGGFWLASVPVLLLGAGGIFGQVLWGPAKALLVLLVASVLIRIGAPPHFTSPATLRRELVDARLGLWLSIPVVAMGMALALSQVRPVFEVRYTVILVPALALTLATITDRLADRRLVPLIGLTFIAYSLFGRYQRIEYEGEMDNRVVTRHVVDQHRPGDAIMNITLNFAPTLHYLRALSPEGEYRQMVFPAEVGKHPGWRDRDLMLRDRASLQEEAASLADSLADDPEVRRLWVLPTDGEDAALAEILLAELGREFELEHTEPLKGWWVSEIRRYVRR